MCNLVLRWPRKLHGKIFENVKALLIWTTEIYTKTQTWIVRDCMANFAKVLGFWHKLDVLIYIDYWVTNCREHIVIYWYKSNSVDSKIFIFGQLMAKKGVHAHIFSHFEANWTEFFKGAQEKFKLWCLFLILWSTLGGKLGVASPPLATLIA